MGKKKYRVFLSAAEPSGDAHCAQLIKSLQAGGEDIEYVGVGGPLMEAADCELLEQTVGKAAMLYKAFAQIVHYYKLIRRIRKYFASAGIDLLVVCDSPAFNFHLAKAAKRLGIPTVFYVAPQLWAWAPWRIHKLRKCCDKLCCILPFEVEWFGKREVESVFVGNPLLDEFGDDLSQCRKRYEDYDANRVKIGIMPGSRAAELESLWLPMQQVALRLKEKYPQASFVTVAVDEKRKEQLKGHQIDGFECEYSVRSVVQTARSVDFSIVTSGSATLQVAAAGCPMVIMYQSSKLAWKLLGQWLVRVRYLSLVNILAGRQMVPEFMPYFDSIEPIVDRCDELVGDKNRLAALSNELIDMAQPMAGGRACERVARIIEEMIR
ncbi:MAG: lipid-A-disaccharide synthase [Planctomycetota bacterium]|jgi:lipid-A-disaccharide synthase